MTHLERAKARHRLQVWLSFEGVREAHYSIINGEDRVWLVEGVDAYPGAGPCYEAAILDALTAYEGR